MVKSRSPNNGETDEFLSSNRGYVSFLLINPGETPASQVAQDVVKVSHSIRWATIVGPSPDEKVLAAVVSGATDDIGTLTTAIQALIPVGYQVETEFKVQHGEYYKLNAGVVEKNAHNGWP